MSGADCLSPLRFFDWVLCVRSWTVHVSVGLVWLVSLVFHYWVEKRRCLCGFNARFLITADREMVPISSVASPFHQIGWVEPYCKKAFVRLKLLNNRYPMPFSTKTIAPTAVSANPTIEKAEHHVAAGMNSLSPNNEKRKTYAQQPD